MYGISGENLANCLVGWKTPSTIVTQPGFESAHHVNTRPMRSTRVATEAVTDFKRLSSLVKLY